MKNYYLVLGVVVMACLLRPSHAAPNLASAGGFAVFGGTSVTSVGNTIVNGDLGTYPGVSITGFGPGIINGMTYAGGPVAQQAAHDAVLAFNGLANEASIQNLTGQNLGGLTLRPGVRNFDATAQLTGTLILDAQGDSGALFIFQIMTTLLVADGSSIVLTNGAMAANVFWQVGTSATIGGGTLFAGSILADQSITLNNGASVSGRALALNGAVTLDGNVISIAINVPEPSAWVLFMVGAAGLGAWHWWRKRVPAVHGALAERCS